MKTADVSTRVGGVIGAWLVEPAEGKPVEPAEVTQSVTVRRRTESEGPPPISVIPPQPTSVKHHRRGPGEPIQFQASAHHGDSESTVCFHLNTARRGTGVVREGESTASSLMSELRQRPAAARSNPEAAAPVPAPAPAVKTGGCPVQIKSGESPDCTLMRKQGRLHRRAEE